MKQWGALAMLALGVGLVQVSSSTSNSSGDSEDEGAGIEDAEEGEDGSGQNPLLGLVMVLLACCTSGFAGVYFEKVRIPPFLYRTARYLFYLCSASLSLGPSLSPLAYRRGLSFGAGFWRSEAGIQLVDFGASCNGRHL